METTACSTSNIRLLRLSSSPISISSRFAPYYSALSQDSAFHHAFWYENNRLFNALQSSTQHPEFVQNRREAFRRYHRECWRRNLRLIVVGLKCLLPFKGVLKYSL